MNQKLFGENLCTYNQRAAIAVKLSVEVLGFTTYGSIISTGAASGMTS